MAKLSLDSKIKEIMRNPQGKEVLLKYAPGFATNPAVKMIQMMTLRKVMAYPEAAEFAANAEAIEKELAEIE